MIAYKVVGGLGAQGTVSTCNCPRELSTCHQACMQYIRHKE
jgi:hypothetical protein